MKVDLPIEDRDGDGTPDSSGPDGTDPLDEDGDGTPDTEDSDDDNDGVPDADDPEHRGEPKREWEKTWEKEWVDNGPQHKADPRVDVSMELGSVEKQLWDASYAEKTFGDEDGNHLKLEALSTEGKAEGSWALDRDGLTTAGTLTAGGYLAKASGAWSHGTTPRQRQRHTWARRPTPRAGCPSAWTASAPTPGSTRSSAARPRPTSTTTSASWTSGVGGEISYGLGAHAEADAEFSADRVGVSVDIGATLGIGGGIELDIGFDPPW